MAKISIFLSTASRELSASTRRMEQSYRLGGGAFPTLIAIISMFFVGVSGGAFDSMLSALLLTLFIVLGVCMTFLVSKAFP